MADNYTQLEQLRQRANDAVANAYVKTADAKAKFTEIKLEVSDIAGMYTQWTLDVDALLAANPNDSAVKALHASKDRIVTEFGIVQAQAEALETAVSQVE